MNWKERLKVDIEPVLASPDPRAKLSAYHDMPYAIFRYSPEVEFDLRVEIDMLVTRLENVGKRVTRISLAECLSAAIESEGITIEDLLETEASTGVATMVDTIHGILGDSCPLVDLVAARLPDDQSPIKDVVLLTRTGALFPVYRSHALLEQLKGRLNVPAVLFYPGDLDGPTGLSFMGALDPDPNYRPRIF
ncbi:MAG: DUF1788 domain-containing protein [Verrucomicrobia bacterium]|nr:DUF1788 domain-containing protein [Verrucomicrobiota bacterium]